MSKLNTARMERGKVGYNWRREHFSQSIGNLGEPPFFSFSQCLSSESSGNPTHTYPHMLARRCVCLCVCVCVYIVTNHMDQWTLAQRDCLSGTTGNEQGDELFLTIAGPYRELLF